jgi:nicotinamidase-related amidase
MSLAPLDERVALVVVDLQAATAPRMDPGVLRDVVAHSDALAAAFRARGLPVVLAAVSGSVPGRTEMTKAYGPSASPEGGDALLPGLSVDASDLRVVRAAWSAFAGSALDDELARRGVTQLVVTGVATSIGVESTARDAYARGYSVVVVADAVTDFRPEVGAAHLAEIMPLLGEVATTGEVLGMLVD